MLAEVTLTIADWGVLGTMLLALGGAITTLVLFTSRSQTRRIEVVEEQARQLVKDKTDKHEWARELHASRERMDEVSTAITQIGSKLDANFGVAAVAAQIVDELRQLREAQTNG